MAANLGFGATVVSDATATHDRRGADGEHHPAELVHRPALASLHGEFASVRRAAEVMAGSAHLAASSRSGAPAPAFGQLPAQRALASEMVVGPRPEPM